MPLADVQPLAGSGEIAALLGVSRQRVGQLTKALDWPAPAAVLGLGAVWRTDDIRCWADSHDRPYNR